MLEISQAKIAATDKRRAIEVGRYLARHRPSLSEDDLPGAARPILKARGLVAAPDVIRLVVDGWRSIRKVSEPHLHDPNADSFRM